MIAACANIFKETINERRKRYFNYLSWVLWNALTNIIFISSSSSGNNSSLDWLWVHGNKPPLPTITAIFFDCLRFSRLQEGIKGTGRYIFSVPSFPHRQFRFILSLATSLDGEESLMVWLTASEPRATETRLFDTRVAQRPFPGCQVVTRLRTQLGANKKSCPQTKGIYHFPKLRFPYYLAFSFIVIHHLIHPSI